MTYYVGSMPFGGDDLQHHGIKGMRWGVRRYRNEDGSLTEAGRKRYSYGGKEVSRHFKRNMDKLNRLSLNKDLGHQTRRAGVMGDKALRNLRKGVADAAIAGASALSGRVAAKKGGGMRVFYDRKGMYVNPAATAVLAGSTVGLAVGEASAAIRLGAAAVRGIQAANAYRKTTIKGHERAVKKYEQHFNKMVAAYGDTPYYDLFKSRKNG